MVDLPSGLAGLRVALNTSAVHRRLIATDALTGLNSELSSNWLHETTPSAIRSNFLLRAMAVDALPGIGHELAMRSARAGTEMRTPTPTTYSPIAVTVPAVGLSLAREWLGCHD